MGKKKNIILIVDDDESIRDTLEAILQEKYTVLKASDGQSALRLAAEQEVSLILLDCLLPDINGLEVLKQIKDRNSEIEVIMISMVKEVETVVRAMKLGAFYYITKAFEYDEVLALVGKAIDRRQDSRQILYLKTEMEGLLEGNLMIGQSHAMKEIFDLVKKVAPLSSTVLILGETGTGKQLIARSIHNFNGFSEQPFVTVDLGALPESLVESTLFGHEKGSFSGAYTQHIGKFELADGGTLFLDEVANLKYELQSKLLRVIQDRVFERVGSSKTLPVNVRLIAATNVDLVQAVRKGKFREDLYFRLNVIPIKLPPLRERVLDIPPLFEFFVQRYKKRFNKRVIKVDPRIYEVLSLYDWPGNIRELENMVERLVALSEEETIHLEDLPIEYRFNSSQIQKKEKVFQKATEAFQQIFILKAFEREGWNQVATAKALDIPLSTLKYNLKKLNLSKPLPKK